MTRSSAASAAARAAPGTTTLHGVQLWVALPGHARDAPRDFVHHVPEPVHRDGAVIGVGTGSTVNFFIDALAARRDRIAGAVSSSEASSRRLAARHDPAE